MATTTNPGDTTPCQARPRRRSYDRQDDGPQVPPAPASRPRAARAPPHAAAPRARVRRPRSTSRSARRRPRRPSPGPSSSRRSSWPSAPSSSPSAPACWPARTCSRRSRACHPVRHPYPSVERELKRYERRGASARNRFERQVRAPAPSSSASCASAGPASSGRSSSIAVASSATCARCAATREAVEPGRHSCREARRRGPGPPDLARPDTPFPRPAPRRAPPAGEVRRPR